MKTCESGLAFQMGAEALKLKNLLNFSGLWSSTETIFLLGKQRAFITGYLLFTDRGIQPFGYQLSCVIKWQNRCMDSSSDFEATFKYGIIIFEIFVTKYNYQI